MPKGPRFTITVGDDKYNFSRLQFAMLSQKTIKIESEDDWHVEHRMRGLIGRRLFRKMRGAFERTALGGSVYSKIAERIAKGNKK